MTERLTRASFAGHEGTTFTAIQMGFAGAADREIPPVALTLTEVEDRSRIGVEAFSCIFHGPKAQEMGQATCRLAHETMGELELFLVPILDPGSDGTTVCYQAVFNRLTG